MRRALAISLLLLFSLPFVSPVFGSAAAEASLPACCRRDGKHHCAMDEAESGRRFGLSAVHEKCPCAPAGPAVLLLPSFSPSSAAAIYAGITSHPAVSPQTAAQLRISFDRSRQKRGPPANSLA